MKLTPAAITLAISLALYPSTQQALEISKIELPDMGDSSGTLITAEEEKELGEAFFRSLHSQINVSQDAEIQEYIQTIGQKLVASSDAPSHPFHFFVVMENDINAFAGPGGYIGVNSGLLTITEAESELASVMAHEIAHITQRHLYRAAEAQGRLSIPSMAAMLAAILLGTQSPALGQAAILAIQAGGVQFQINFTRENEAEADRVGMQNLAGSQFDPRSMPIFFERLQQSTRYYGQAVPEFLRTHPVTTSRISDSRGRAETYPYKQYPDSLNYQLTKAKIQVITSSNLAETEKQFQARLNQGTTEQRTVARYALGLIAIDSQRFKEAENTLKELVKTYPNQPQYATALARNASEAHDFQTALSRYKLLMEQYPENEAIKIEYIRSLLKVGDALQAKSQLAALNQQTQGTPIYWELLAQTYSGLNQPAESHRYLAEYYYATGQNHDAILQIKLAQQSKGLNYQLAAILDERLRFFFAQEEARRQR